MLKNKKAIYILIPLNIAIWGFFIYRFYTAYNEMDEPLAQENPAPIKLDEIKDSVTYKLSLDYKDPFLRDGEKYRNAPASVAANQTKTFTPKVVVVKTPTVVPKQLPEIKYLGLIKNSTSGASTALVSINGQSRLIKAGETVEGISFKSFDNNEMIAMWGKEKMVVRR